MRTLGAVDVGKRKTRSDKRNKYRKNRHGNMVLYIPKRKRGDPLRIWFWEKKPMSYDGYKNFSPKLRRYVSKWIYRFVGSPVSIEPEFISNPDAIGQTAINVVGYDGVFYLMMPCHAKNTYRVSYKKRAVIKLVQTDEGLRAVVSNVGNMKRYWFWRGR